MKVNILTKGFLSPTTRGWLYPVVKNKLRLSELGINLSFHLKQSKERFTRTDSLLSAPKSGGRSAKRSTNVIY